MKITDYTHDLNYKRHKYVFGYGIGKKTNTLKCLSSGLLLFSYLPSYMFVRFFRMIMYYFIIF